MFVKSEDDMLATGNPLGRVSANFLTTIVAARDTRNEEP
jgi:hypothetical protein